MRNLNPAQLLESWSYFFCTSSSSYSCRKQLLLICIRIHMHSRTQLAP